MKSVVIRFVATFLAVLALFAPGAALAASTEGTHIQAYHQRVPAHTQRYHQNVASYRQRYWHTRADGVRQRYWHTVKAHSTTVHQNVPSYMTTVHQRVPNGR